MKMVSKLQANIPSPNTGEQKSELIDLIGKNPLGEVLDDKTSSRMFSRKKKILGKLLNLKCFGIWGDSLA